MKKLYAICFPVLFCFCGCIEGLHNASIIQNDDSMPYTTDNSQFEQANNEELRAENTPEFKLPIENEAAKDLNLDAEENISAEETPQPVVEEALDFCQLSQDFWQKGEFENALEALDQAYFFILNVNTDDNPKLIQQKEDLRFMISKRILEIYASRNIVVNGNHNAIPLTMNKYVQAEINRFTGREKKFFIESYKRSGKYRPFITKKLKEAGLPIELSWLPLIESGFKLKALSTARALGLWQFIPSTGYKFGLKRDRYVDERMDPVKSTIAAIAYLKELHQIFGDWMTVLAAYNCGEARVLKLIRDQKVNYLDNFWDLYERLPRETARYVPRFLATLHVINNSEKYGTDKVDPYLPLEYDTITVSKQVHLKNIAKRSGVSKAILKELNPELRYDILPAEEYSLKIPPNKGDIILAKIDKIPVSSPPRQAYIVKHRVKRGESLSTIASRYNTSVSKITRANNIHKRNYIIAGKILKIPHNGAVISKIARYKSKKRTSKYVVKRGDSLWLIARRFNVTTKQLKALNNLSSTRLHIGQILNISGNKRLKTYRVKSGDSPSTIAKKYNMPLKSFLLTNNLTHRSRIYPGQRLYVK